MPDKLIDVTNHAPAPGDDRWPGDPQRVAIVLPGNGYHPDLPLTYWTGKVVRAAGWIVQRVWWQEHNGPPDDRSAWPAWVGGVAAHAVEREHAARRILLIGKSLGTFAVPYAVERGLPGIWLTPLISERFQPDVRLSLRDLPHSLLAGGTGDPSWDSSVATASGHVVCEIPGADHGLEFDGDPIRSVDALKQVMAAVRDYVDGLESVEGA
jgi:acetyl esterase/lipase